MFDSELPCIQEPAGGWGWGVGGGGWGVGGGWGGVGGGGVTVDFSASDYCNSTDRFHAILPPNKWWNVQMNVDCICVSRNSRTSCHLVPPFIINKHTFPFVLSNQKYQCYLYYVFQLLLPILWTICLSKTAHFDLYNMILSTITKCN